MFGGIVFLLIGPGTISAGVIIGERHATVVACLAILTAVAVSLAIMVLLKLLHDFVRRRNAQLIQRYVEIAGRITALYVGTVAVETIMQGFHSWNGAF